jgi:hypothetical protein
MKMKITVSKFTRNVGLVTALAAFFAAGVTVAAVSGTAGATAGDVGSPAQQSARASSVLEILNNKRIADDTIPALYAEHPEDYGESGLILDSTRLVGTDKTGSYYTGEDNSGNVCILMFPWVGGVASSCTTVEQFAAHGIGATLQSDQTDSYIEAYLLPDRTDLTTKSAALKLHGKNLLVGDTRGAPENQRVQRFLQSDGKQVELGIVSGNSIGPSATGD